MKWCIVFCSFFVAQCLSSEVHTLGEKGKCPDVSFVKDFNPQKMLGKWFSIEETGKEVQCEFYHFEETETRDKYRGHFYPANITITLSAVNPDKIDDGFRIRTDESEQLDNAVMKIAAVDYDTHAVVFTCKEFEDIFYPHTAIWSRTNELSEEKLAELRDFVKTTFEERAEGHLTTLKKVDHSECSYPTLYD